jgi:peptidoglycan hydrolase-like protein with peptidoglycan-binding domain
VLRIGSSGPDVRDLQEILNLTVPVKPLLTVDGLFGPKTAARVVMFQKQAQLVPDGVVGYMTCKALVGAVFDDLRSKRNYSRG